MSNIFTTYNNGSEESEKLIGYLLDAGSNPKLLLHTLKEYLSTLDKRLSKYLMSHEFKGTKVEIETPILVRIVPPLFTIPEYVITDLAEISGVCYLLEKDGKGDKFKFEQLYWPGKNGLRNYLMYRFKDYNKYEGFRRIFKGALSEENFNLARQSIVGSKTFFSTDKSVRKNVSKYAIRKKIPEGESDIHIAPTFNRLAGKVLGIENEATTRRFRRYFEISFATLNYDDIQNKYWIPKSETSKI